MRGVSEAPSTGWMKKRDYSAGIGIVFSIQLTVQA